MSPVEILIVELALRHHNPDLTRTALEDQITNAESALAEYRKELDLCRGSVLADRRVQLLSRMVELATRAARLRAALNLLNSVTGPLPTT